MKHIISFFAASVVAVALSACANAPRNDASVRNPVGPDKVVYHINRYNIGVEELKNCGVEFDVRNHAAQSPAFE